MPSPSSMRSAVRLAAFMPQTEANGPGTRAAVWLQGCERGCPGCFNPEFAQLDGGTLVDPAQLAAAVLTIEGIDGVTLSGGEPFLQAPAAAALVRPIAEAGLSVLVYTGFLWEALQDSEDPGVGALLSCIDILIDGPFVQELADGGAFRGSSNQRVIPLTSRGEAELSSCPAAERTTEVDVVGSSVRATGDVESDALEQVRTMLAELYGVGL